MRVGTVCYANTQGLGYLAKAFYDNHIITDPVIQTHSHSSRPVQEDWYPEGTPRLSPKGHMNLDVVMPVLDKVDVMIFFETPFNWGLLNICRQRNVKTVLIPMYEWTPTQWHNKPDVLFCPSRLDREYFVSEFPEGNCPFIPIPVNNSNWKLRTHARRFLHNAGNIGHREHKGTRELLMAVNHVRNPTFTLTIRAQDTALLESIIKEVDLYEDHDLKIDIQLGEIPYEELWDGYDVYIAPEKFNGLSLPLQEAYAAGMMVMTTDRFPFNTWLPLDPLIPVQAYRKARVSGGCREFDEAVVSPIEIAKHIDSWFGRSIERYSLKAKQWGTENSWQQLAPVYKDNLLNVIEGRPCQSF